MFDLTYQKLDLIFSKLDHTNKNLLLANGYLIITIKNNYNK